MPQASFPLPSPVELLQTLIRFDTTNPPGNEAACIGYLNTLLQGAGLQTTLLAQDPARPNLIARLPGRGERPPLMFQGHVDVVTTAGQPWAHPPFAAEIADGMLWGRGTLDDKGSVALMVHAVLRAQAEGVTPPGDILLVIVADEEVGQVGARFLVEQHPEQFAGVRYAIGEGGGFSVQMAGRKFYPIMVAEKRLCTVQATFHGPAGHGSLPLRGGAMAQLGRALQQLDRRRLPVHITPVARRMYETLGTALGFPTGTALRLLLVPAFTDRLLNALGPLARQLEPTLHNTANPTLVRGGEQFNVIPAQVSLGRDGRLLPGFTADDLLRELRALLGAEVTLEVVNYEPGPAETDWRGYEALARIMQQADPQGTPFPYLLSGVTDARFFSKLGIQTYGFVPLDLPDGLIETVHAADERVPVAALEAGAQIMYQVLLQLGLE
jgi:acetylornithine deacetylase/succinyl-diaminopimelate desuccinylase-like protein